MVQWGPLFSWSHVILDTLTSTIFQRDQRLCVKNTLWNENNLKMMKWRKLSGVNVCPLFTRIATPHSMKLRNIVPQCNLVFLSTGGQCLQFFSFFFIKVSQDLFSPASYMTTKCQDNWLFTFKIHCSTARNLEAETTPTINFGSF